MTILSRQIGSRTCKLKLQTLNVHWSGLAGKNNVRFAKLCSRDRQLHRLYRTDRPAACAASLLVSTDCDIPVKDTLNEKTRSSPDKFEPDQVAAQNTLAIIVLLIWGAAVGTEVIQLTQFSGDAARSFVQLVNGTGFVMVSFSLVHAYRRDKLSTQKILLLSSIPILVYEAGIFMINNFGSIGGSL